MKPVVTLPKSSAGFFTTSPARAALKRFATGVLVICSLSALRADIPIARGSLSLTGVLDEEYDSNIFANQFRISDWHTTLTPGAKFVRDAGLLRIDSQAGVKFQRFQRHDEENSTDPFAEVGAKWVQEETSLDSSLNAYFRRVSEANVDVNARSRVEELGGKALFGHFPTEKLGYRLRAEYHDQDFRNDSMSDIRTHGVGADVRYHYSTKLDVFVGAGKRWSDTYHVPTMLPTLDSEDTNVRIGVEGEILTKLSGQIVGGWVRRTFKNGARGAQSGLLFDTSVTWRPDDETSFRLLVSRDLDTTPVDQSVMRQVTGIEARRQIREKLGVTIGYSHNVSNYIGVGVTRHDKANIVQLGADYSLTKNWKTGVHVNYAATNSNDVMSDYNRFVGGANVSVVF